MAAPLRIGLAVVAGYAAMFVASVLATGIAWPKFVTF